jgi:hypothetical protein
VCVRLKVKGRERGTGGTQITGVGPLVSAGMVEVPVVLEEGEVMGMV